jgi:hypothetical protein
MEMRKAGTGMKRSGVGSGGGYGSRQIVHPSPKADHRSTSVISPSGTGQIGQSQGGRTKGEGHHSSVNIAEKIVERSARTPVELGNSKAMKAKGIGQDRTVYPTGSQHGLKDNPMTQGHDILGDYGKDAPGKRQ